MSQPHDTDMVSPTEHVDEAPALVVRTTSTASSASHRRPIALPPGATPNSGRSTPQQQHDAFIPVHHTTEQQNTITRTLSGRSTPRGIPLPPLQNTADDNNTPSLLSLSHDPTKQPQQYMPIRGMKSVETVSNSGTPHPPVSPISDHTPNLSEHNAIQLAGQHQIALQRVADPEMQQQQQQQPSQASRTASA
eukprot:PhM_4_TR11017/c0_g2_i1/m.27866